MSMRSYFPDAVERLDRPCYARFDLPEREMDARETTIFTTALLLGCDMTSENGLSQCRYRFRLPDATPASGAWSDFYRSKVTCADMFLSHIGVYVDPQGVVYIPPNLKG